MRESVGHNLNMRANLLHDILETRQDLRNSLRKITAKKTTDIVLYREIRAGIRRCNFLLQRLGFRKAS